MVVILLTHLTYILFMIRKQVIFYVINVNCRLHVSSISFKFKSHVHFTHHKFCSPGILQEGKCSSRLYCMTISIQQYKFQHKTTTRTNIKFSNAHLFTFTRGIKKHRLWILHCYKIRNSIEIKMKYQGILRQSINICNISLLSKLFNVWEEYLK